MSAPGTLAIVNIHFENGGDACEFGWVRLSRQRGGFSEPAAEWKFAG